MAGSPRGGTVTLLFADIAGSTRLLHALGDQYAELLRNYRALMADAAEGEQGLLMDTAGDGLFYSFPTARGALTAAIAAQRAFRDREWPAAAHVEVRMGIHTGEPLSADASLVGLDVHRAARICSAGHGGQVLISLTTHNLIGGEAPDDVHLQDLGEHRLKDLPRPEHLFQVLVPDLPGEFPPLRSIENWPNNLPRQLSSFVGRADALSEVAARLGTTPLLTLTGPGGVGKTRLALEAAARAMDEFPDGAWVVELAAIGDGALVPEAVASVLRIKEQPGIRLQVTLAQHLASRRLLLMFDDCEHVLEPVADLVDELLRTGEGLRVLATSREPLGIAGESLYPVPSMSVPDAGPGGTAGSEDESEAVRLFVERARAVQPAFLLNDRNGAAVIQICQRLDGIPLAIELAAARVKAIPPEQIAARLDDRFRLLTGGSRMALPRHRTLKAAIDWSFDLLADAERTLFLRLSVFAGTFDLEAVEFVCSGDDVLDVEALDILSRLIDRSLVVVDESRAEARYRLLDTIHQYAAERLGELDLATAAHGRHRAHFLMLVEQLAPMLFAGPQAAATMERLALDHENLRVALQWADDDPAGAPDELRLAAGLARYWDMAGHLVEGRSWLARAVARTDGEISELRATALTGLGGLAAQQGDLGAADSAYSEALTIQRQLGRPASIAYACSNSANIAVERGDFTRARGLYEEAIAILRGIGDQRGTAFGTLNLADVAGRQGDVSEAQALFDDAVGIFRAEHDLMGLALALGRDATFRLQQTDADGARARHGEALEIYREFGDGRGVARTLMFLGDIVAVEGDLAEAERLYRAAIDQRRQLGDRAGLATACDRLARVLAVGRPELAARLIGYADAQRDAMASSLPPADASERDQLLAALSTRLGPALDGLRADGRRAPLDVLLASAAEEEAVG